jgi:transcriptional regulator with XRE-family HTH domain
MLKDTMKFLRESKKLTKKQVADAIGVTERAYITYEYGQRDVSTDTLQKLADFYGVTTDYLLGREPAPDPFAERNLNKESEDDGIDKYMSLPPNIRACLMDVLVQLGDAAKRRQNEQPDGTQGSKLSVSTASEQLRTK